MWTSSGVRIFEGRGGLHRGLQVGVGWSEEVVGTASMKVFFYTFFSVDGSDEQD
jgi:hypothetical protein